MVQTHDPGKVSPAYSGPMSGWATRRTRPTERCSPMLRNSAYAFMFSIFLSTGFVCADTEGSKRVLGPHVRDLTIGRGMNAVNRDLRGTEIVGQDLRGAIFDGCSFAGARFFDCILAGASFKRANLQGVKIGECNIDGADFTDAIINNMIATGGHNYVDLSFATSQIRSTRSFKEKNLSRCVIRANGLSLHGFDLSHARISGDMVFDGAKITNAYFGPGFRFDKLRSTVDVQRGRFPCHFFPEGDCDMSGLVLEGARIDAHGRRCTSINLTDTDIDNCTMVFTDLGSEIVAHAVSSTRNYKRGVFNRTSFVRADFSSFKFDRTLLVYSLPGSGSNLTNATFHDAVIFPITPEIGLTAEQLMQTWNYKQGRLGQLRADLQAKIEQLEQQAGAARP